LNLVNVLGGELDYLADGVVVDCVDDGGDQSHLDADRREVLNRAQLHVEEVADAPVLVLLLAHAVELQIDAVLSGLLRLTAELYVLRVAYAVRRGEYAVEADLLRVGHGVKEVGRERWLAAREEYDYLPSRLERDGAVEYRLRVLERRLVDIADLIGVHETRVAHHVAAVRQVNSENRAAAELYVRRAVLVYVRVFGGAEVAAVEE